MMVSHTNFTALLLRLNNYFGSSIQISHKPGDLKTISFMEVAILFLSRHNESASIVTSLDIRSHVFSIKNRRFSVGKPVLQRGQNVNPLLHLIFVFLVFRFRWCKGFFLTETGFMCDSGPSFRRFLQSGGSLFQWILFLVAFLIRGFGLHEFSFCSREDALTSMRFSMLLSLL